MFNVARVFNFYKKNIVIEKRLRRNDDIVYGARAMNAQLLLPFRKHTDDYDIYSKHPKKHAKQMEKALDRSAMGDYYYTKPALHPGTFKVMDKGFDRRKGTHDDFGIIDFTKQTKTFKTINKGGIRYTHLSERVKDIKRSLNDPLSEYRHEKDKKDLYRIKQSKLWRRF